MSNSPIELAGSLRIGKIDFVSPDEIKVLLDIEAPDSVALNTGTPRPFPRINGYVLVPSDDGYLVGQVEWITVEPSQYPKRKGMQDFGLVDLPFPLRKMRLNPLGTLSSEGKSANGEDTFRFRRGVNAYPSVGDNVLLPTQTQLKSILEFGEKRHVKIGTSPLAENAEIKVDPDRLFGRHLAVLGNTGSGKSCSVAGMIRWSLEAAKEECPDGSSPNARFIVLDPNGEYRRAFTDFPGVRLFAVEPTQQVSQLGVPLWFWNTAEWTAFTRARPGAQRPVLVQALRAIREGFVEASTTPSQEMRRFLRTLVSTIQIEKNAGRPWGSFPHPKNFLEKLAKWKMGLVEDDSFSDPEKSALSNLRDKIDSLESARSGPHPHYDFNRTEVDELLNLAKDAHSTFGGSYTDTLPIDADVPRPFSGNGLLQSLQAHGELLNVQDHVETLLMRVRTLLSDSRMSTISGDTSDVTLENWLNRYIGENKASNGTVTIIDLSLVPSEVVHIVTSIISRMTFEALQRYRKANNSHKVLPTVLVMEEAHTFVRRYKEDADNYDAAAICCQLFERIAREGRKFGLGLILSSQRPTELSPTVLSQCNTFLLHRISNDSDQNLVNRLVPDNLRGLLRDLPSLPSQDAILLGWASELPVLVRMNHLPEDHQPQSDDPDFWDVWTGAAERTINWKEIADDWQQVTETPRNPNQTQSPPETEAPTDGETEDDPDNDEIPF